MASKSQRILSYLPPTFGAAAGRSALRTVAGAFGDALQAAENGLPSLMMARWVDHADRGAREIDDLARLAALYGLRPRPGEGVEAFRRHLKRTVRTLLDGTVTVEGILRLTADTLGLRVDESPGALDGWWLGGTSHAVTPRQRFASRLPVIDEAAPRLLGFLQGSAHGGAETAARVVGRRDLGHGIDLRQARFLRLSVDAAEPVVVDCAGPRPRATTLDEIVERINQAQGSAVASHDGRYLILSSPTVGKDSRLRFLPTADDARELLFGGVEARTVGSAGRPATLVGEVTFTGPVDLGHRSRLRLAIDGAPPFEVDVAGSYPGRTSAPEVVAALNAAVPGLGALTDDGRLQLSAPTAGVDSRLEVLPLRWLEVREFPPEPREQRRTLCHGELWPLLNAGAAEVSVEVELRPLRGAVAPALADLERGWSVRLLRAVGPGETLRLARGAGGKPTAWLVDTAGEEHPVPDDGIRVEVLAGARAQDDAAWQLAHAGVLSLPRGRSRWLFRHCRGSRFDSARFGEGRFDRENTVEEPWTEVGIFGASRFAGQTPVAARFAPLAPAPEVEVRLRYQHHRPGAFEVHLPADLPESLGGRFGTARLGTAEPERYAGAVTEPEGDADDLVAWINVGHPGTGAEPRPSTLVTARRIADLPPTWGAAELPFRHPLHLRRGGPRQPARLFLAEAGVEGFLELAAREPGAWGDGIAVSVRPAGQPARWEVEISFAGARCENARQVVLGAPPPSLAQELSQPGPLGVLQAKAAGVEVAVTRDRTSSGGPQLKESTS